MRRGVATVAGLAVVTAVIGLLTRPLIHSLRADTVTVDLGILPAPSERARIVDEHVLASIESHAFGRELRLRLDRPSRRMTLEPFLIDRCEVRQIDFERFAKWYGAEGGSVRAANESASADGADSVDEAASAGEPTSAGDSVLANESASANGADSAGESFDAPDGPSRASIPIAPAAPGGATDRAHRASDPTLPATRSNPQDIRSRAPISTPPDARSAPPTSASTGHRIAGLLHSPATGVDFSAASLYCAAVGGRLPWAEELEAAASGMEGRLYAWGDTFDPGPWPYLDAWRNAAQPCGSHPHSDSPQGVHDLNGNAMEWSAGNLAAPPDTRQPAAHGAPAVRSRARFLYALNAAWLPIEPTTRSHHLGFRCAYDSPPPEKRPWGDEALPYARIEGGEFAIGLPPDVRLARLAVILPDTQLREARTLLASAERANRRIEVGRCEVSRRQYRTFLNDPLARSGLFANPQEPVGEDYIPGDWERQTADLDLPVSGMSWWAADAFARWAGGRLPRAREWRLLAAGPEARLYPWGNRYDPGAAVTADLPEHGPRPCPAAELRDTSASGVLHLAGNVSEWTQSIAVDRGNYAMWVQGGNWLLPGHGTAQGSFGRLVPLNHRSPDIGLRVVYDWRVSEKPLSGLWNLW